MMRSLFSGVSGLQVHQTKMDIIANNISNVNTVGFKSSRVTFNQVFSQQIQGASGTNVETGRGGVNPMQIGLGASVGSIDKLMTQGASQRTDNSTDLMIDGDGFFIVGDGAGTYFTRAGAMNIDENGYLVNSSGLHVKGWDAVPDPKNAGQYIINKAPVQDILIGGDKNYVDPQPTTNIQFSGNLNAATDPIKDSNINFYDNLGNVYQADVTWTYTAGSSPSEWNMSFPQQTIEFPVGSGTAVTGNFIFVNGQRDQPILVDPAGLTPITLTFDINGLPIADAATLTSTNASVPIGLGMDVAMAPDASNTLLPDSAFGTVANGNTLTLDFSTLTQFGNQAANAISTALDGNKPGQLSGLSFGGDGKIYGAYSNGQTKVLGQVPIALFQNPAGLESIGGNLFQQTANSGSFDGIGQDVSSAGGTIQGGVLEMSNVNLAAEFTEMITTQRGFQANSRVITTSDDMLQELVNLKR